MKRVLILLLAALVAVSMAACGGSTSDADTSGATEATEAAEGDAAEGDATDTAGGSEFSMSALPELDGFTKTEQGGVATYAGTDGTMILVQTSPADAAVLEGFKSKSSETQATLDEQLTTVLNSMIPGSTASGAFETVGGKDVYTIDMSIAANAEAGIPMDIDVKAYMLPNGDQFIQIFGVSMGTDIDSGMQKLIESI